MKKIAIVYILLCAENLLLMFHTARDNYFGIKHRARACFKRVRGSQTISGLCEVQDMRRGGGAAAADRYSSPRDE